MADTASHLECQSNSLEAANALMAAAGWDRVGVAATTASGAFSVCVRAPLSLPEGVVAAFSSKDDSRKGGSCRGGCYYAPRLHHNRGSLGIGVLAPHHKHG